MWVCISFTIWNIFKDFDYWDSARNYSFIFQWLDTIYWIKVTNYFLEALFLDFV